MTALTPQLEERIQQKINSGRYASASEVIQQALTVLDEYEEAEKAHSDWMRREVMKGVEQIRQGKVSPFDDEAVEQIKAGGRERLKALRKQ